MKLVILILTVCICSSAFAKDCKVFGISDSPQKLDCRFGKIAIDLRCNNGDYYLNEAKVTNAFHMEVEDGPTPLVFKSSKQDLTVLIESPTHIEAELLINGKSLTGSCL